MCLIKDGLFSPIRLFCHKYIETKRKSAKSDCVINSYIQNNKKNKKELRLTRHIDTE